MVNKEELQGNMTPVKSALYAAQEIEKMQFDFWGRFFIKLSLFLGVILYLAIGAMLLFLPIEIIYRLFG